MDMMSKSTDDTLSEAKKLEIGQNAAREKDVIEEAEKESKEEQKRRNIYIACGAGGTVVTGGVVVGFEIA